MADLPMPSVADLPTPTAARPAMPKPPAMPSVADLPTPKSRQPSVSDLPAPVARGNPIVDLPTPRHGGGNQIVDLPTPRHGGGNQIVDLPTPKHGVVDLPTPKPGGPTDVPAPKGFFDDLPQPSRNQPSPTKNPDLPAPKGFFDDLPGKVNTSKPEVPAPKGFFDDLPGRVNSQKAAAAQAPEVPAPKGFFDDLPGRPNATAPQPPAPKGFFDDLPQPAKSATQAVTPRSDKPSNAPIELDLGSGAMPLDLGLAGEAPSPSKRYDDLDLSMPSTGIKIDANKAPPAERPKAPSIQPLPAFRAEAAAPTTLELEEPRVIAGTQKLGPKRKSEPALDADALRAKARRTRILALVALLVVGLGAAGFYVYSRWAAKRAVQNTINEELAKAKVELSKADIGHWDRAATAAALVIEADPKHSEALGIFAEAKLASAISTGIDYNAKVSQGRATITKGLEGTIAGPNMLRAQALNAITQGIGDRALELLKPQAPPDTKDPTLLLYLGWAHTVVGDSTSATKMFDAAIANSSDYLKVCALYGRGQAKLDQADLEGASADFKAVLAIDKEHIGAQVGMAAALPASQVQQQEKDLLALFERKDFATSDPRAVVKAWSLAAEAAKRGGRLDAARERYRNALAVMPEDLGALAGSAEIELRDNKLDAASEQIGKALAISKEDIRSQLVQSEISVAKKDYNDARARVDALSRRDPPPPKRDQARIKMAAGRLAEFADGKDEVAAELYEQAAELAGDADLSPTLTAVGKYSSIAEKLEPTDVKKAELLGKASKLLEKLETQADKEPDVALALGAAYLRTGDAVKAEPWLYKFVEARPDDAEGQFQLAKALARQDKIPEAITRLGKAIDRAPKRVEFRVELARTYERAKDDAKAGEIYEKLLAEFKETASVEVRASAGRFFARKKQYDKAGEQGEQILKVVPNHVVGQYLKGEGLLLRNAVDDARLLLGKAAAAERDTYYFEALGRANMAKANASGEVKFQQLAIDAFKTATMIDDNNNDAHFGLGLMYMGQKQWALAIPPLAKANKVAPEDIDVMAMIGLAFYNLKDAQRDAAATAIVWFEQARKTNKDGVVVSLATINYHLGRLYEEQNRLPNAASALDEAVDKGEKEHRKTGKMPGWYADAQYFRGRVYKALNNVPAARDAWTKFLGQSPSPNDPHVKEAQQALATSLRGN
jgi:tetratricopeptide (TPR) repeat protein